jgi:cytochrome c
MRNIVIAALAGAAIVPVSAVLLAAGAPAGDSGKGKTVFARCAMCHDLAPGVNRLGPSLAGLFGRKAGSVANFNYSPAMKGARIVWNDRTLAAYLAKPNNVVPGNRMLFPGLADPADRANLIAYLRGATRK